MVKFIQQDSMMHHVYDYVSKTLGKYIIKIPSINLPYSKEFETRLTSSKMACSDMITCTAKHCFSKLLGIVTKVLNFVWMTYRCLYIVTGWLPGDSSLDSSHAVRRDDNN